MKAIIIHGMPEKGEVYDLMSESHWILWLKKNLEAHNIETLNPEMPEPYEPSFDMWKAEFEKYELSKQSILIGHSCGAGFLVRYLNENKINVAKLILVGPWMDPDKSLESGFFDFEIDEALINRVGELYIMYSTDDGEEVLETVETLKTKLPDAQYAEFKNKGHFTIEDMGTEEFPELLELVLN